MNKKTIFYLALLVAVLLFLAAIYYLIPGHHHLFTTGTASHSKHAIVLGVLGLVAIGVALVNRPKAAIATTSAPTETK